jgi:hypothetical protein
MERKNAWLLKIVKDFLRMRFELLNLVGTARCAVLGHRSAMSLPNWVQSAEVDSLDFEP